MSDRAAIQAYSARTGVDRNGYAYITDKVGGDELVNTTLQAWDKLIAYEKDIEAAKAQVKAAQRNLDRAYEALSNASTPEGVKKALGRVGKAQDALHRAESRLHSLENGHLGFQKRLMENLGLDSSRLTQVVKVLDERPAAQKADKWKGLHPTNAFEEWAQVYHTAFGARDDFGVDVRGDDGQQKQVHEKDAIESYMRYGQWTYNEFIKDMSEKIMRGIARAASGKGFSMTAVD